MSSAQAARVAAQAAGSARQAGLFGGKASQFYREVCRCVPFIRRTMKLDELVSTADIRRILKDKWLQHKDVTDPRVIDMLIFKGREELEVYLTLHKQRHHAISEYLDPIIQKKTAFPKAPSNNSAFLDSFLTSNYTLPTGK